LYKSIKPSNQKKNSPPHKELSLDCSCISPAFLDHKLLSYYTRETNNVKNVRFIVSWESNLIFINSGSIFINSGSIFDIYQFGVYIWYLSIRCLYLIFINSGSIFNNSGSIFINSGSIFINSGSTCIFWNESTADEWNKIQILIPVKKREFWPFNWYTTRSFFFCVRSDLI
jgi:hypothetical protein